MIDSIKVIPAVGPPESLEDGLVGAVDMDARSSKAPWQHLADDSCGRHDADA